MNCIPKPLGRTGKPKSDRLLNRDAIRYALMDGFALGMRALRRLRAERDRTMTPAEFFAFATAVNALAGYPRKPPRQFIERESCRTSCSISRSAISGVMRR